MIVLLINYYKIEGIFYIHYFFLNFNQCYTFFNLNLQYQGYN